MTIFEISFSTLEAWYLIEVFISIMHLIVFPMLIIFTSVIVKDKEKNVRVKKILMFIYTLRVISLIIRAIVLGDSMSYSSQIIDVGVVIGYIISLFILLIERDLYRIKK